MNKNHNTIIPNCKIIVVIAVALVALAALFSPAIAAASDISETPKLPLQFCGTLHYSDGKPLPVGTVLIAEVNGFTSTYTLVEDGKIGGPDKFDKKFLIDGAEAGDTIIFTIQGMSVRLPYEVPSLEEEIDVVALVVKLDDEPELPTSLTLSSGWNFISIPWYPNASCATAGKLFAPLATGGTSPLGYDASSDAGWYVLTRDTPLKPLDGYWLYVEEPATLNLVYADESSISTSTSTSTSTPTKQLYKGWNAVGVSSKESVKAKDAFTELSWVRYLPWSLDADAWGRVIVNGGSAADSEENYVTLGNGGWLYVEADGVYRGVATAGI